jgi:S1-C subfamily serine protease
MKRIKGKIWGIAVAAFLSAMAVTGMWPSENKFERAQRATVLLSLPDGQGSGVVVRRESSDGTRLFIWTAAHVVEGFNEAKVGYFVRYQGARVGRVEFTAQVLARDKAKDIALLWLKAPPGYFGSARFDVRTHHHVGDYQYHVGNFFGEVFDGSVSTGVISQIGVKPEDPQWPWAAPLDQTTCAAIFGSSGGPVFDSDNKICGLIVGGPVGKGFIEYVPTREIVKWADSIHVSWAVVGDYSPNDIFLQQLAQSNAVTAKPPTSFSVDDP